MTSHVQTEINRWKVLFIVLEAIVLIPFMLMVFSQLKSSRIAVLVVASCTSDHPPRKFANSAYRKHFLPALPARHCAFRLDRRVRHLALRSAEPTFMISFSLNKVASGKGALASFRIEHLGRALPVPGRSTHV